MNKIGYCYYWDAKYDRESGKWLETTCTAQECPYCKDRPDKHQKDCKCKEVSKE